MIDRRGRDQFAVRFGDETEIGWNDAQRSVSEKVLWCCRRYGAFYII